MHELRHGYNLADLHEIARHAVATDWSHHAADYHDRYDIAWSAVAEHLYAADNPTRQDLLRYARYVLHAATQDDMRHRGVSHHTNDTAVNAVRYWALRQVTHTHEDRVVDSLGLWQIWSCMRDADRQTLLALAAHEDYAKAADALGMRYYTFCAAVRRARQRFLVLWHDGEQPSTLWGRDRRAAPGGDRAAAPTTAARMTGRRRAAAKRAARNAA
ncbi:hypothetical protein [Micromonospora sp. S-DT3-3-22]|uniref:hypothetical protein n=1 Tax=Micromonospora sp. S-DT3-3-22 TaxID=2755359 RepID=UPI00188E5487|nr:hypothetical protein [Micromonospora sp. S-DT3-3-22]